MKNSIARKIITVLGPHLVIIISYVAIRAAKVYQGFHYDSIPLIIVTPLFTLLLAISLYFSFIVASRYIKGKIAYEYLFLAVTSLYFALGYTLIYLFSYLPGKVLIMTIQYYPHYMIVFVFSLGLFISSVFSAKKMKAPTQD